MDRLRTYAVSAFVNRRLLDRGPGPNVTSGDEFTVQEIQLLEDDARRTKESEPSHRWCAWRRFVPRFDGNR